MDQTDRKILAILQADSSLPIAEVAARVNLSQTPCWRRIQRLEANGVIQRKVAIVDPEKVGIGVQVLVAIETGDHTPDWLQRFEGAMQEMPEVMEVHRTTGDIDYLMRVAVADMPAYDAFYKKLIATVPIKKVTSRFSVERVKWTTAYAIPAQPSETTG